VGKIDLTIACKILNLLAVTDHEVQRAIIAFELFTAWKAGRSIESGRVIKLALSLAINKINCAHGLPADQNMFSVEEPRRSMTLY